MVKLLKGHNNEEKGLIIENYPYGFRLRTKIKYWIETDKKKGDRFVSQTLNPKTGVWNKPKYSVYNAVMVMCQDEENGHISYYGLYPTTGKEEIENFLKNIEGYELSPEQADQIRVLKAWSKAYENVEFKCVDATGWTEEQREQHDKEQRETRDLIAKEANYHYNKEDF